MSNLAKGGLVVLALLGLLAMIDRSDAGAGLFGVVLLAAYFLPLLIATKRNHHQTGAIAVINILLGWTFIGWVIALAMASSAVRPPSTAGPNQS
jgi:hypothetical protein